MADADAIVRARDAGSSLVVTLPKEVVEALRIKAGKLVRVKVTYPLSGEK